MKAKAIGQHEQTYILNVKEITKLVTIFMHDNNGQSIKISKMCTLINNINNRSQVCYGKYLS